MPTLTHRPSSRAAAWLLAAALSAGLCATAGAQTLTIGVRAGPESIDPHFTATGTQAEALKHVFDTLVWSGDGLEVQPRLQQYAGKQSVGDGWGGGGAGAIQASPSWREAQAQQRPRVPATGDTYADASAEIADIDGRLQSLQNFLRAAKAGQAVAAPV
jgi:hypothetical protein